MIAYVIRVGDRVCAARVQSEGALVRVELDGRDYRVALDRWLGSTHYRLTVDGKSRPVILRRIAETLLATVGEDQYRVQVARQVPIPRRGAAAPSGARAQHVTAPMPGLIISVDVRPGEAVEQGRPVAIMEAMKMQMEIRAPAPGRIVTVHVRPEQEVASGTVLVTLEPT